MTTITCVYCENEKDIGCFESQFVGLCIDCNKGKKKYNKDFLERYCRVKGITLVQEYKDVTRDSKIIGECLGGCGEKFEKGFRKMVENGGAYCKKCESKNRGKKAKETLMKTHGVEHVSQLQEVKDKKRESYMKHYGVENPSQSKELQDKKKKNCLEKYGVEHPSQVKEIKEKGRNTCLEKYNVSNPAMLEEVKEKMKETSRNKYGVDYPVMSEEVKKKIKETKLCK